MTATLDETWQRIRAANEAVGWAGWPLAQRDQIEALADDLNRDLLRYPVIHAWRTKNGSQLQFWCRYCKDYHVHGRHSPNDAEYYSHPDRVATENPCSPLPQRMWLRYLSRFANCTFDSRYPGGRGICTCPMGSGDGHRAPHCWRDDSGYKQRGYLLHEVEPEDPRATTKPPRLVRVK